MWRRGSAGRGIGLPRVCIAWHARHGIAGRLASSGANRRHGPAVLIGADQVADAALEVHSVAAQAVVLKRLPGVVLPVEEDPRVGGGVRARLPVGELLPVALLAARQHVGKVGLAEPDGLGDAPAEMPGHAMQVVQVKRRVQGQRVAVAGAATHVSVSREGPLVVRALDLVTARAAASPAGLVVQLRGARREQQDRARDRDTPVLALNSSLLSRPSSSTAQQAGGGAVGDGHDGQHRIEAAVGDVDAAVDHEQVVIVVDPAVLIDDRGLGIVAHAAGAGLVLAAAEAGAGQDFQVCVAPASFSQASAFAARKCPISMACGCRPPESRATGMPQWSFTAGSTWTRESKTGISCTGPRTAMLRR